MEKDVCKMLNLAEEITSLKEIQTMLKAIINSSEEAISVVDENGKGLLINPAYTRLTGLTEEQVIGKPATADISEGESMHMRVLQTKKAVRGVAMPLFLFPCLGGIYRILNDFKPFVIV